MEQRVQSSCVNAYSG